MAITKESTPPPVVGKIGRYTVFMTPPATPKGPPKETERASTVTPKSESSTKIESPKKVVVAPPPPVQPPPQQFKKPASSNSPAFGLFWNVVAKVQNVHSSLDQYMADWFGLDQSRYQWALNDYYESRGMNLEANKHCLVAEKTKKGKEDANPKDLASKGC